MLQFKEYLKEYLAVSTSEYVFDPNGYGQENANALKIPISGPMFRRIWPDTVRASVFHVTTANNLKLLDKLQGQKKSISAFFRMDARVMEGGVATEGGVVAELDADILVSARDDIMSFVDKTGRRWVELNWFENALGNIKSPVVKKVEKDLNSLIMTLVKKYLITGISEGWLEDMQAKDRAYEKAARAKRLKREKQPKKFVVRNVEDAFDLWSGMKRHLNDGKKLRLVIKDYFDGVEKILKKHKKDLTAIFYSYVKSKRQTDNEWDEQIVNNIKIKKVHVLKNMMSDKDWEDLANSPYPLQSKNVIEWDHAIDLEMYIGKIVKQEARK